MSLKSVTFILITSNLVNALHGIDLQPKTAEQNAMYPPTSWFTVNGGAKSYFDHGRNWRIGKGWNGDVEGIAAWLPFGNSDFAGNDCTPALWSNMGQYSAGNHIMITDIVYWVVCIIGPDINLYPDIAAAVPFKGWIQFHLVGCKEWSQNAWYTIPASTGGLWDTPSTFVVGGIDFTDPLGMDAMVAVMDPNNTVVMHFSDTDVHCQVEFLTSTGVTIWYVLQLVANCLLYPICLFFLYKIRKRLTLSSAIIVMVAEGLVIPGLRANRLAMAPFYVGNMHYPINDWTVTFWCTFVEPFSAVTTLLIAALWFRLQFRFGSKTLLAYNASVMVISAGLFALSIAGKLIRMQIGTTTPEGNLWLQVHNNTIFWMNLVSTVLLVFSNAIFVYRLRSSMKDSSAISGAVKKMLKWMVIQLPIQVLQVVQTHLFNSLQVNLHYLNCAGINFVLFDLDFPGTVLSYLQVLAIYDYQGGSSSSSSSSSSTTNTTNDNTDTTQTFFF